MEINLRSFKSLTMLVVLVLAAVMVSAQPVQASGGACPAPGTGMAGAYNMLHDATMWTIAMARDAAQGNVGMFGAVFNTACQ